MRFLKKALPLLLILCVFLSVSSTASAEYDYTVRIYAGNEGAIDGGTVRIIPGVKAGTDLDFDAGAVTVFNPDKYFVKGLRESGRDNHDHIYTNSIPVNHDVDYVVAYGIYGSRVSFTLICVDANTGRELARETHYGNIGDEILIKSPYINRYRPQASYVHRTLEFSSEERTLLYYPITQTTTPPVTPTSPAPQVTPQPGGDQTPPTEGGGEGGQIGAGGQNPGATTPGAGGLPQEDYPETEDVLDMDVPLAAPEASTAPAQNASTQKRKALPLWALILAAVSVVGLIVLLFWYLLFYRKKKWSEEEDGVDYDFNYDDDE